MRDRENAGGCVSASQNAGYTNFRVRVFQVTKVSRLTRTEVIWSTDLHFLHKQVVTTKTFKTLNKSNLHILIICATLTGNAKPGVWEKGRDIPLVTLLVTALTTQLVSTISQLSGLLCQWAK